MKDESIKLTAFSTRGFRVNRGWRKNPVHIHNQIHVKELNSTIKETGLQTQLWC